MIRLLMKVKSIMTTKVGRMETILITKTHPLCNSQARGYPRFICRVNNHRCNIMTRKSQNISIWIPETRNLKEMDMKVMDILQVKKEHK